MTINDYHTGISLENEGQQQQQSKQESHGTASAAPSENKTGEQPGAAHQPRSIDELIVASNNPEALALKKEIDDLRKQRKTLIYNIHQSRRRLEYKEKELLSVGKRIETERHRIDDAKRKVWKLKRSKEKLEFRISTEASSLTSEKELIRKVNEVNLELNEALKYVKLDRKTGLVKKDIEENKTALQESEKKLGEVDLGLDERYNKVRNLLGIRRQQRDSGMAGGPQSRRKHVAYHQPQQEINLEDIAVIKRK